MRVRWYSHDAGGNDDPRCFGCKEQLDESNQRYGWCVKCWNAFSPTRRDREEEAARIAKYYGDDIEKI